MTHLAWRSTKMGGGRVGYGVGGEGIPVLFLHGWALGQHSYKRALKRLMLQGCRVYAPSLPGSGGTAGLAEGRCRPADLGRWCAEFLEAVGEDGPVLVAGHSLGGAVATAVALVSPERVSHLVLINPVGGGVWRTGGSYSRAMAERPLWQWALDFTRDTVGGGGAVPTLRAALEDAGPNIVGHPVAMWRSATVARRADLTDELAVIRAGGTPVTAITSERDLVIPRCSFEAVCDALGVDGVVVAGGHSWLLGHPDVFGQVMAPVVESLRPASRERLAVVNE